MCICYWQMTRLVLYLQGIIKICFNATYLGYCPISLKDVPDSYKRTIIYTFTLCIEFSYKVVCHSTYNDEIIEKFIKIGPIMARGPLCGATVIVMALRRGDDGEAADRVWWGGGVGMRSNVLGPPNSSQDLRVLHLFIISRILLQWVVPDNLAL